MFGLLKNLFSPAPQSAKSISSIDTSEAATTIYEVPPNEAVKALWLQAEAAHRNGNRQEAYRLASLALDIEPNNPELMMQTGVLAFRLEQKEEAVDYLLTAIHLRENFAEALHELGVIYRELKNLTESHELLKRAVAIQPENPIFICDLGVTKVKMDEDDEAIRLYERAIELKPDYAIAYNNLGHVLIKQKRNKEALEFILIARGLEPNQTEPLINLSKVYYTLSKIPEAHRAANRVLGLFHDNHSAWVFMFWYYALYGKFDKAWPIYHYRFSPTGGAEVKRRDFGLTDWQGEPLADKSILVIAEQGLGDQIMFLSCLPDLLAISGKVVVECDAKLQGLFQYTFLNVMFLGTQNKAEESVEEIADMHMDYQTHIGSLPVHFRPCLASFDQVVAYPYLLARPEKMAYWKSRLTALPNTINIGISWRGGAEKTRSYLRSIALKHWLPILQLPNINFINLQYGDCQAELNDCLASNGITLHHWPEMIANYQETAALLCNLDLVISVCTSVIHLAGALAVPTWVLVPSSPEWRYMAHGEHMPWYPSVNLYRQAVNEEWTVVIARLQTELIRKLNKLAGDNPADL